MSPYGTSRASLLGSPTKIGILLDSSRGYFSPKMKLLQRELAGKYRTILFRDPAEQRDHFAQVLGDRTGESSLWAFPSRSRPGSSPTRSSSHRSSRRCSCSSREFPLIYARVKQLRGDLDEAINDYVKLRFTENAPLVNDKKNADPQGHPGRSGRLRHLLSGTGPPGKAQLDRRADDQQAELFRNTLELLPEPGPSQPYYHMLRWGPTQTWAGSARPRRTLRRPSPTTPSATRPPSMSATCSGLASWSGATRWPARRAPAGPSPAEAACPASRPRLARGGGKVRRQAGGGGARAANPPDSGVRPGSTSLRAQQGSSSENSTTLTESPLSEASGRGAMPAGPTSRRAASVPGGLGV